MKTNNSFTPQDEGNTTPEDLPINPVSDDAYHKYITDWYLDPENNSPNSVVNNEKAFQEDVSGDDLDIPGSELDDAQETVGSEDEENNYYSLGDDNPNN